MYHYSAYGLGITSAVPLPALNTNPTTSDVEIRLGEVDRTEEEIHQVENVLLRANPTEVCYFTPSLGAFSVREGKEIIVDANPDADPVVLGQFILGLPLAMLLHQRGLLILHASAVVINGSVVAFLGYSGQGKSTTVAALHQRNYPLVTDDALAIAFDGENGVKVFPSHPQIRLWPESVTSLGDKPENLPTVYPTSEKRSRVVEEGFCDRPWPLKRIYVLEFGETLHSEPLETTPAFAEITNQSYPELPIAKAMDTAALKFQQCSKLAQMVPICRLSRPRDFSLLPQLVNFIEEDVTK